MRYPSFTLRTSKLGLGYDQSVVFQSDQLQLESNCLAIIGHNGAGKSTLMKSMLGLLPPLSGKLEMNFKASESSEELALLPEKHMAFCPETGAVFADLKVEEYLRMWCRIKQGDDRYYLKEGSSYIELLNVGPLLRKFGRELSKGQRRRVQTAIGFLTAPKLFLFDEPFDGLDVQKTSELSDILRSHQERMCFVVSSHRMDVVERLADRILVLDEGAVLAAGELPEVIGKLCGGGLQLAGAGEEEGIHRLIRSQFPDAVLSSFGSELRITDQLKNLSLAQRLIGEKFPEKVQSIKEIRPSLTDAMNYHLQRSAEREKSKPKDSELLKSKKEASNLISIFKLLSSN